MPDARQSLGESRLALNRPTLDDVFGKPETRRTLSSTVASRLRDLIVTGQLKAGTPLRLKELAARLGVSMMPVREALRYLESEGLVVMEPHRGASVARLSMDDVEELYAVRGALEGLAARLAAPKLTAFDQEALVKAFARMERDEAQGDLNGFVTDDREFHMRLYEAAGRPRLVEHIREMQSSSARALPLVFRAWQPLRVALEDHRPILEAVQAGDSALVEARTREHLEQAAERVLAILRSTEE